MSTETGNRWKKMGQSVCGATVVLTVLGFCGSGILSGGMQGNASRVLSVFAAGSEDESCQEYDEAVCGFGEEEMELEYADIWSMPTFADLRESIKVLQQSRDDVLKAAADGEAEGVLAATQEYQAAVQEVQDRFATLKNRVDSDEFACVSQEFLGLCAADKGQTVIPSELGYLKTDIWE